MFSPPIRVPPPIAEFDARGIFLAERRAGRRTRPVPDSQDTQSETQRKGLS